MKKILFVSHVDFSFVSHRLFIAERLHDQGWDVYVACRDTGKAHEIKKTGIKHININVSRSGMNPVNELFILLSLWKIFRKVKPDVIHNISLKMVVYGTIVARWVGIKNIVNSISGLGYMFMNKNSIQARIMSFLMKISMNTPLSIIFQNNDDLKELKQYGIIRDKHQIYFTKGVGIDIKKFKYVEPQQKEKLTILFPARMQWHKGVQELYDVTQLLKNKYKDKVTFVLLGMDDRENKEGVSKAFLLKWSDDEYVKWVGHQDNVLPYYIDSDIVVLLSYREGIPKSLLEACSVGRPIVTTHAIGCKDCVEDEKNGYKVPVYSKQAAADSIETLILSSEKRLKMGQYSRKKAEREFDCEDVFDIHFNIYRR